MDFTWNPPDFTWNPHKTCQISPEICTKSGGFHLKSARFHEIRRNSWMWAFGWSPSIGLSFERPTSKSTYHTTGLSFSGLIKDHILFGDHVIHQISIYIFTFQNATFEASGGVEGGEGFTENLMRVCVNCESCILGGGFTMELIRVDVNCESPTQDSQFTSHNSRSTWKCARFGGLTHGCATSHDNG